MKQSEARALIQSRVTVKPNGCWIWPTNKRYGSVVVNGKFYSVHRMSYMAFHGRIGNKHVCHRCDVTQCVNPDHLFLGTHADNMADMAAKDRGTRELQHRLGKLTDEDVVEMRDMYRRGYTPAELADEFDISVQHARAIVRRRVVGGYETRYHADESIVVLDHMGTPI